MRSRPAEAITTIERIAPTMLMRVPDWRSGWLAGLPPPPGRTH